MNYNRGGYLYVTKFEKRIDDETPIDELEVILHELRTNVKIDTLILKGNFLFLHQPCIPYSHSFILN